ncbi:hypothetical protein JKP88DRAFT_351961 [Tribonema minus]|uniref:R3H domain-containing protein n=1 Tax=Tribonema minus TaxID=303371 RepID=A0A835ZHM7_9STRA|nr:hypothetical protein JKP88DRAFT_351961 [Tribonema minus]
MSRPGPAVWYHPDIDYSPPDPPPAPRDPDDDDDSLAPVPSTATGAGRASTPVRVSGSRAVTPQRAVYAAPIAAAQEGRPSQHRGRRRQRRWANDNFFGIHKAISGGGGDGSSGGADAMSSLMQHLSLDVSWRSSLGDLVADEVDAPLRTAARQGAAPAPALSHGSGHQQYRGTHWEDAEERFARIPKRLRDVVTQSLHGATLRAYVAAVEATLLYFITARALPPTTPDPLAEALRTPLQLQAGPKGGARLGVALHDSPFHRLLLHAACQYHGLLSKSDAEQGGVKTVYVSLAGGGGGGSGGGGGVAVAAAAVSMCAFVEATRVAQSEADRLRRAQLSDGHIRAAALTGGSNIESAARFGGGGGGGGGGSRILVKA